MRLSSLKPIDLETLRELSLARARKDLDAGDIYPVTIACYPGERPHLADGRHRVVLAMRRGVHTWPALVRVYGPRGGLRKTYFAGLHLDALP
jgi:hypothetical protein